MNDRIAGPHRSREKAPKNILVSYPRSANTWVRFFIEWFSGEPTEGCLGSPTDTPIYERNSSRHSLSHVNKESKAIIEKTHTPPSLQLLDGIPKYVFLLRNYKEVITRHTGKFPSIYKPNEIVPKQELHNAMLQFYNIHECQARVMNQYEYHQYGNNSAPQEQRYEWTYIKLLENFHQWTKPKLLIYYEDLITEPESTIKKIVEFLEIPNRKSKYDLFFSDYDNLKNASVNTYHTDSSAASTTKGNDILFHSKNIAKVEKDTLDNHIKRNYPDLVPYVERYFEK